MKALQVMLGLSGKTSRKLSQICDGMYYVRIHEVHSFTQSFIQQIFIELVLCQTLLQMLETELAFHLGN